MVTSMRRVWRIVAVVIGAVALYAVAPAFVAVVLSWPRLSTLAPLWMLVALLAEALSFSCSIAMLWLAVGRGRLRDVVAASLTGNAVTNTVPGGDVVGAGVQFRMLRRAGMPAEAAAGGLAVASVLDVAGHFLLPVFAVPALGGTGVNHDLAKAAYLGLAGFLLISVAGLVALSTDRPLETLGRALEWANRRVRHREPVGATRRLLAQRDLVRAELGRSWWRAALLVAGHIGFDYASILAALLATGARPNAAAILVVYTAGAVVALVPITPGGIGIVEASLGGLLVLAGVPGSRAVLATLAYRIGSYWLPILSGAVSYLVFRHRYGPVPEEVQ
jgi:uncharacterized protein (TIRG00374 family)